MLEKYINIIKSKMIVKDYYKIEYYSRCDLNTIQGKLHRVRITNIKNGLWVQENIWCDNPSDEIIEKQCNRLVEMFNKYEIYDNDKTL